jgi:hypothetical protein
LRAVDYAIAELKKPATAFGVALSLALLIALTALVLPRRGLAVAANITPAAAVDAVVANHIEGPVLNDYGFGGYLIFRGFKVFIDGRADFYGDAFIKRYAEAIALQSDEFFKLVDQYGIAWTLLPPDRPAVRMLDRLPGWRRLYGDDIAVVHVRDTQNRP